ncbi:ATP-NAD kinase family protein [Agromyces sp. Root1464]|uniref:ATP-NAD kinase family protein n=1 Tax=Agromyces sp. Root1464 TaxID=1736467 RepID=UPI000AB6AE38|nr:NAD(+)/NADH kinase [Agromyces sp. Root1464]
MIALVVNPIAGVGGPAGLAGSDGAAVQERAEALGSRRRAAERARLALETVAARSAADASRPVVITAAGAMGEDVVRAAGLEPRVVFRASSRDGAGETTAADTTAAARALVDAGASLVLFAGGDGTARDVAAGLGTDAAALGIPAGVKMYSPVFAVSPRAAGALAASWVAASEAGRSLPVQEREVLDVDEAQLRVARVEPRLYATMPVPYLAGRTQARKSATPASEHAAVVAAARGAVRSLRPGVRYLLGPGGTMAEVARELGVAKTPLGVDVVLDGAVVRAAASESELLDEIAAGPARAVVSVIGGQGFLLGRGNQQLSARVLRALGPDPLVAVAPEQKLIDLGGRPLLVDTGDAAVDARLAGFVRVITSAATTSIYPVTAPDAEASDPEGEGHAP